MFTRIAQFVIAHRRAVIGAWLLAAAVIVPFSPKLGDVTNSDEASFLPSSYESAQAAQLAARAFPEQSGASGVLVFKRRDGGALTPRDRETVASVSRHVGAAGIDRVVAVQSGAPAQRSRDGRVELAQVRFRGGSGETAVMDAAEQVRAKTAQALTGTDLKAGLTGDAAIKLDDRDAHSTAEKTVGVATIGLILLLLLAMFRSPVAALLPIASIALVFLIANSLIALTAQAFSFDVGLDLPPLLTVVLFGIGTDYILFTLFRFREGLREGEPAGAALAGAAARVGEVITFAAFVVIVAFAALGLSQLGSLRTMAPGLVTGVALMWLAGVTLIPALLSLLGARVFWPAHRRQRPPARPLYRSIGALIARRPGRVGLASGGLLVVLAAGALFYSADYNSINQLPASSEARRAYEDVRGSFPAGSVTPTQIYLSGKTPLDRGRIAALMNGHDRPPGVAAVRPPLFSADGRSARIDVVLSNNPYSNAALDAIEGPIRSAAHNSGAGEQVLVGGPSSVNADVRAATNRDLAVVFPVAALVIGLLLAWLLRSLVAPLYMLGAVLLGFAATLGFTVAAFEGLLGQPGLKSMLPIILYLFVVAVGTDYSILMATRLREEARAGSESGEAVARAVEHGGPAVAAAGVILAGTFTSLLLTGIASLMQIGFAVSSGIAIASLVMATLLVPSLTALLGDRAWWPGHRRERGAETPIGDS